MDDRPAEFSRACTRRAATTRGLALTFIAVLCIVGCTAQESAHAGPCDAILGKWTWFTQGVVTFNADGTMVHEPGNEGTWECNDANRVTLRWRQGDYVNRMALSPDGLALSSVDPSQSFVTGRRINSMAAAPATTQLVLATQPQNGRALPKDLPELMKQTTDIARKWRADAVPVALNFEYLDPPNPKMKGPRVKLSFFSPADGTGQFITVTPAGTTTHTFNQRVTWGTLSLLPAFVDLPAAVRIAIANGAKGPIDRASLRVWNPQGAPPVLAWMVGNKTIEGTTGEIIDFDVTGYIASYNAQWEHAARGLRALLRASRGNAASGSFPSVSAETETPAGDDGSAARAEAARAAEYERNAAEARAYHELSTEDYNRIKGGDCTWTDSTNGHC